MRFEHADGGSFNVKKAHIGGLFFVKLKQFVSHETLERIPTKKNDPTMTFWIADVGRLAILSAVRKDSITIVTGTGKHKVTPGEVSLLLIVIAKKKKRAMNFDPEV